MIITKLNVEQEHEMDSLRAAFEEKLKNYEANESILIDSVRGLKAEIQQVRKRLTEESVKRRELEEEINDRGSGHEEEVKLRLEFASRLNNMHARVRDLEIATKHLTEANDHLQIQNAQQYAYIQKKKKQLSETIHAKLQKEQEIAKISEEYATTKSKFINLQNKYDEVYGNFTDLKDKNIGLNLHIKQLQTDIVQRDMQIKNLLCDNEVLRGKLTKYKGMLSEQRTKEDVFIDRIQEIESTFAEMSQTITKLKSQVTSKHQKLKSNKAEISRQKDFISKFRVALKTTEDERDILQLRLASATRDLEEAKVQLRDSVTVIDSLTKGRHQVENQLQDALGKVKHYKDELTDKITFMQTLRESLVMQSDLNKELQQKLADIQNVQQHENKQSAILKDSLQQKVKTLQDILAREKEARKGWMQKYEEKHNLYEITDKELKETKQKFADSTLENDHLKIVLRQTMVDYKELQQANTQLGYNLAKITSERDSLQRKNFTIEQLLENADSANALLLQQNEQAVQDLQFSSILENGMIQMEVENCIGYIQRYITKMNAQANDIQNKAEIIKRKRETITQLKKNLAQKQLELSLAYMRNEEVRTRFFILEENLHQVNFKNVELKQNVDDVNEKVYQLMFEIVNEQDPIQDVILNQEEEVEQEQSEYIQQVSQAESIEEIVTYTLGGQSKQKDIVLTGNSITGRAIASSQPENPEEQEKNSSQSQISDFEPEEQIEEAIQKLQNGQQEGFNIASFQAMAEITEEEKEQQYSRTQSSYSSNKIHESNLQDYFISEAAEQDKQSSLNERNSQNSEEEQQSVTHENQEEPNQLEEIKKQDENPFKLIVTHVSKLRLKINIQGTSIEQLQQLLQYYQEKFDHRQDVSTQITPKSAEFAEIECQTDINFNFFKQLEMQKQSKSPQKYRSDSGNSRISVETKSRADSQDFTRRTPKEESIMSLGTEPSIDVTFRKRVHSPQDSQCSTNLLTGRMSDKAKGHVHTIKEVELVADTPVHEYYIGDDSLQNSELKRQCIVSHTMRLPLIRRKKPIYSVVKGQPDIKKYIKQANSRRKNDYSFS